MSFANPETLWLPKLTGYRVLVLTLSTTLGVSKIILTYRGGPRLISIAVEWVFVVIVGVAVFWLGLYEKDNGTSMPWLFGRDYGHNIIRRLRIPVPLYVTEERQVPAPMLNTRSRPPLTGYHLLVNVSVVGFGITKAVLSYRGSTTTPNVLDWVSVVIMGIGFYCLGLFEHSSTQIWPAMFNHDYTLFSLQGLLQGFAESNLLAYTLGIVLASAVSYGTFLVVTMIKVSGGNGMHEQHLMLWCWRIIMATSFCAIAIPLSLLVATFLWPFVRMMDLYAKCSSRIKGAAKRAFPSTSRTRRIAVSTASVVLRTAVFVLAHAIGIVLTVTFAYAAWKTAVYFHESQNRVARPGLGLRISSIIMSCLMGSIALATAFMSLLILFSLIRPVFRGLGWLLHFAFDWRPE